MMSDLSKGYIQKIQGEKSFFDCAFAPMVQESPLRGKHSRRPIWISPKAVTAESTCGIIDSQIRKFSWQGG